MEKQQSIAISLERYTELITKELLLDMLTDEKDIKVTLEYRLRAKEGVNV